MQIFENKDQVSAIYNRAISLSISKSFAHQQNGDIPNAAKQNSEQENRRRELLAVEEQTHKNKIIKEHGQSHYKSQVKNKFFTQVMAKVNNEFYNKEGLFSEVLKIDGTAPTIFELLSVKAASINRISPLVKALPWLANDLITLVNKPQYRRRADVQVTESNLALSYIGLDNLKLVMPTFFLKRLLPLNTKPFPLMKRKLWNDSLSIAMATRILAEKQGIDGFTAFTAGMLSNVGYLAVTRCFLDIYNDMHNKESQVAYNARDKKRHDVFLDIDAAPELLLEQISKQSCKIGADLIELMRFDRLRITEAMFDLAYNTDIKEMCPIAQAIAKAKAYVCFRSLAKENLIESDEVNLLLTTVEITPKEVSLLKKSDIDHIKLNFS